MAYRCVSVNSQVEYDFGSHTIYPQSILFEDINQDNKNELIIGTTNGEILIYKGSLTTPWLKNSKPIGCITCMAFDNLADPKIKNLIVHDALGYVYFFNINPVNTRKRYASDISSAKSLPSDWKLDLTVVYQTKLLLNPKNLLIDDIYNNGIKKMIVGYTDRIIRVYGWINENNNNSNNNNSTINNNSYTNNNSKSSTATLNSTYYGYPIPEIGKFILEQTWELPDQVNSIHIFKDSSNIKHLLASQPGGHAYLCKPLQLTELIDESNSSSTSSLSDLIQKSLIMSTNKPNKMSNSIEEVVNFFADLSSIEIEKSTIPTYLITNINFNKSDQYTYLITMNGDIFFFKIEITNSGPLKTPIWHKSINALVMKYYKCDINKDGNDELIVITTEGQIFLFNCSGGCICFDVGEPVRIFHIGYYSSELPSLNLIETGTSSEADLHQGNTQAFELALDASPIPSVKADDNTLSNNSNSLCFIYVSSITNKICLLQADKIISYSRLKPESQIKYRCENIFSHRKHLSFKLNHLLDNQNSRVLDSKLIHDILYLN